MKIHPWKENEQFSFTLVGYMKMYTKEKWTVQIHTKINSHFHFYSRIGYSPLKFQTFPFLTSSHIFPSKFPFLAWKKRMFTGKKKKKLQRERESNVKFPSVICKPSPTISSSIVHQTVELIKLVKITMWIVRHVWWG